jgi:GNAT superfamily N-acetyltransferase
MLAMSYQLRDAVPDDAAVIARHRVRMFNEMGELSDADIPDVEAASAVQLRAHLAADRYHGWVMESDGVVVAGVGVLLRVLLPRAGRVDGQPEAYILNVYTDPAHRRHGLARRLMEHALAWCRARNATRVVLHASMFGRPMYEQLGFAQTNEMKLELRPPHETP